MMHLKEDILLGLEKVNGDGENVWNPMGFSFVVETISTVGTLSGVVGWGLHQVLLEDFVNVELAFFNAAFSALVVGGVDWPGLDQVVWAHSAAEIILVSSHGGA